MRLLILTSIFALVALTKPVFANGTDTDLFGVTKAYHPQNVLEIQALMNGCSVQGLDFMWHMNQTSEGQYQSAKRSKLEGEIRKRFKTSLDPKPENAASCAKAVPKGIPCSMIAVTAPEISWVENGLKDPSLIIRADTAKGQCHVGAYLDLGSRVVEIQSLSVKADGVSIGLLGVSFTVRSLTITPKSGAPMTFPCIRDCAKREGL